jgi:hypothetical protein
MQLLLSLSNTGGLVCAFAVLVKMFYMCIDDDGARVALFSSSSRLWKGGGVTLFCEQARESLCRLLYTYVNEYDTNLLLSVLEYCIGSLSDDSAQNLTVST